MKTKGLTEKEFLNLLQRALQSRVPDPRLAASIYDEVARQVQLHNSLRSFEKFCEKGALPDIEEQTIAEFKSDLIEKFGEGTVTISPEEDGHSVNVEIAFEDRSSSNKVKVASPGSEEDEGETNLRFVPFPVSLPEDPELIWVLARREDLSADEAARSLSSIEEEFWATKGGQKLLRDRVDRSFAEFIANVPASALIESGLKRHYKDPETLKTLRLLAASH